MAGGAMHIWAMWATQILILFSFALQIFLFVFARTRQRGSSAVLRILLWLSYLMADATAVYTLGHLSISGLSREQNLEVFWAPFLLVHLGSQDNITAYALEDNQLWPRHLLNLGVQAFGVAHIVYKHIAKIPTLLGLATVLMSIIGVIKYGERIWALKCATLDNIQSSIKEPRDLPTYYNALLRRGPRVKEHDEEEFMLFAQAMLPVCKGAMVDTPMALFMSKSIYELDNWSWKAMCKVVEMELSLMYDILYTKAAVIHTWYGYLFHLVSPLPTALVFALFQLSGNKDGYDRIDVAITYILLVGAFLLDMVSVFNTLGSTWTCNFLLTRDRSRLGLSVMSLRRHFKAFTSNRGWSGSIGQYNLFHFCTSDRTKRSKLAKMMGLKDWWNKCHYSETLVISESVKELVFKRVWILVKEMQQERSENQIQSTPNQKGVEEPMAVIPSNGFRPEFYNDVVKRRKKFDNALNLGAELQEAILTWHILTNVFVLCSPEFADPAVSSSNAICISRRRRGGPPCFKQKAVWSSHVKAIKALSDYMVFLVAVRPNMVPGELRSLYVVTTGALRHQWLMLRHSSASSTAEDKGKRLAHSMLYRPTGIEERSIILSHGTLYAKLLLELVSERNRDKSGVISSYEDRDHVAVDKLKRLMPDLESSCRYGVFDLTRAWALILDTWVRLLVFASVRCSTETHARQISRGGDLMTVVWLMEEHANVFFNQSSTIGDDEEAGRAAA